jgi:hypothetical protein
VLLAEAFGLSERNNPRDLSLSVAEMGSGPHERQKWCDDLAIGRPQGIRIALPQVAYCDQISPAPTESLASELHDQKIRRHP